jgi:aspartate aminotransferase
MQHITATRLDAIKPSATLAISAKAAELRAEGKDVISLASGEPDFAPPANVLTAAKAAIDDGFHYYTPVDGMPSLKKAVQEKFKRENNLDYATDEIIISTGGKQSVFNVCQALLNPGDEVLIPAPYWVSYPDIVKLAEATPVIIEAGIEQHYKITAEQLAASITPRTKMLLLNSPSNPTGMVYSPAELQALADVLLQHPHVYIVSDDIYEHICWANEPYCNIVTQCPALQNRSIIINGVSKAYAMTGWRIGYAAGPAPVIKAMKKLQSQCTSNPCAIAQKAAEAALTGPQDCLQTMQKAYLRRQQFMLQAINALPGFTCKPTQGAFYLFVDVSEATATLGLANDIEFASHLLTESLLAVVPGTAFGSPGHIRLSYATSDENLQQTIIRLQALFA